MGTGFGDKRTISASDKTKKQMKQLVKLGVFHEQRDAWSLGASLGITKGETQTATKRGTFQNINSLDPDGIFEAIMVGLYSGTEPDEMIKKLCDHAEWGVNEIFHRHEIGTLDFAELVDINAKK